MKKLFFIAITVMAAFAVSCAPTDVPSVEFYDESMTVSADGGDVIIPVRSTGVDNVTIVLSNGDRWVIDENGDRTPKDSWVKIVKVIEQYDDPTRALAEWDSGISLYVEPNTTGYERSATIIVQSFMVNDKIKLTQLAE